MVVAVMARKRLRRFEVDKDITAEVELKAMVNEVK